MGISFGSTKAGGIAIGDTLAGGIAIGSNLVFLASAIISEIVGTTYARTSEGFTNKYTKTGGANSTIIDANGKLWKCKDGEIRMGNMVRVENLFLDSGTPVTQDITVEVGKTYTVSLSSGSITLSGAATGTVTSETTITATTTTLTCTVSSAVNPQVEEGTTASEYVSNGALSLGDSVLVNGTFDTDISGWTLAIPYSHLDSITWVNGTMQFKRGGQDYSTLRATRSFPTIAGTVYKCSGTRIRTSSYAILNTAIRIGTTDNGTEIANIRLDNNNSTESWSFEFTATGPLTYIAINDSGSWYNTFTFDDIAVLPKISASFPYHGYGVDGVKYFAPDPAEVVGETYTLLEDAGTNLFLNSDAVATQTITVTDTEQYTISVSGPGSLTLSGAATGTVDESAPVTVTASSTSLTLTLTDSLDYAQVEPGTIASSLILTAGSAVTRTQELLTFDASSAPIPTNFSMLIDAEVLDTDTDLPLVTIEDANNTGYEPSVYSGSVTDITNTLPLAVIDKTTLTGRQKLGFTVNNSTQAIYKNGSGLLAETNTYAAATPALNTVRIGHDDTTHMPMKLYDFGLFDSQSSSTMNNLTG